MCDISNLFKRLEGKMLIHYDSLLELAELAESKRKNISDLILLDQAGQLDKNADMLYQQMAENLQVMKEAVKSGLSAEIKSESGLSGGNAYKFKQAIEDNKTLGAKMLDNVVMRALAVAEVNATMGRIVAAPTAGSCGIIPAVLLTLSEEKKISERRVVMSLFTAAGIGMVIAKKASISGAEGGCQAECGSASAMAAAAAVEISGGSPMMVIHACAMALKNTLGLVCDPVAGLVEVPCIKRNTMGAVNALSAASMALAGIESVIPPDEVITAMKSVGDQMVGTLKETAEGGLAATPTGKMLAKKIFGAEKGDKAI